MLRLVHLSLSQLSYRDSWGHGLLFFFTSWIQNLVQFGLKICLIAYNLLKWIREKQSSMKVWLHILNRICICKSFILFIKWLFNFKIPKLVNTQPDGLEWKGWITRSRCRTNEAHRSPVGVLSWQCSPALNKLHPGTRQIQCWVCAHRNTYESSQHYS